MSLENVCDRRGSLHALAGGRARDVFGLHHYADYCAAFDAGLRRDGLDAIDRMVQAAQQLTDVERDTLVASLCGLLDKFGFASRLIPYPLRVRLLEPTLSARHQANNADALRWLGELTGDIDHLERAWELSRSHAAAKALLTRLLRWIDDAGHELPHGLLASRAEYKSDLERAEALVGKVQDPELIGRANALLQKQRAAFSQWMLARGG